MALTVATLAGFPAINTAYAGLTESSYEGSSTAAYQAAGGLDIAAGTPTDAATFAFTSNVYTQSGTQYVAGILDTPGVVPSKIFYANNGTGNGGGLGTQPLPTLVSITRNIYTDNVGNTLPEGYVVILLPAEPGPDAGSPAQTVTDEFGHTVATNFPAEPILIPAQGYTSGSPTAGYPQPQIRVLVSGSALLILASTQYG